MGCLYWLVMGWWLEPLIFISKAVFFLTIGWFLKLCSWVADIIVHFISEIIDSISHKK